MNNRTMAGFAVVGGSSVSAVQSVTANPAGDTTVNNADPLNPIVTSPLVGLIFIEKQTTVATVQDITFNTGINGNTDGRYVIIGRTTVGLDSDLTLRPNNSAANGICMSMQRLQYSGVGVPVAPGLFDAADMRIGTTNGSAGDYCDFRVEFNARVPAAGARTGTAFMNYKRLAAAITLESRIMTLAWVEAVTNITSLVLHSGAANCIGIGSIFSLYKVAHT